MANRIPPPEKYVTYYCFCGEKAEFYAVSRKDTKLRKYFCHKHWNLVSSAKNNCYFIDYYVGKDASWIKEINPETALDGEQGCLYLLIFLAMVILILLGILKVVRPFWLVLCIEFLLAIDFYKIIRGSGNY